MLSKMNTIDDRSFMQDGILYCLDKKPGANSTIGKHLPMPNGTIKVGELNYGEHAVAEAIFHEIRHKNISFRSAGDSVHVKD